jgi:pimeloyl-ACP methyl ester carboxylesterase
LQRFHLVVHDVGGPVGFELAAAVPDRVKSLTVLNTIVDVDTFKRPCSMEPFARRGVEDGGRAFLKIMRGFERTAVKRDLYRSVLAGDRYPVQVVWGREGGAEGRRPRRGSPPRRGRRHDPLPARQALPPGGPGTRDR